MSERRIILRQNDYTVLKSLVDSFSRTGRIRLPHFARLAQEVKQALVMEADEIPADVITMGSRVNYTCIDTDITGEATIVFPAQAKDGEEYVSILAPLGLALIGEREGTEIAYIAPGGTYRIRINKVEQAERASAARQGG